MTRSVFSPLVQDTVFDPHHIKYKKHTFLLTNLIAIQIIVFIYLSIAIATENSRVGGSNPPPGTIFQNDINDLVFTDKR